MLLVVVATGATVRLTARASAVEHWPGCQPGDAAARRRLPLPAVEFSNRIVAGITILMTLVTWLASRLDAAHADVGALGRAATFLGTFGQAPLGAITVYYDLNPWLVLSHFLLSLVVLTLGVLVALEAWDVRGEAVPSGSDGSGCSSASRAPRSS